MGVTDSVAISISVSAAPAVAIESLNVPLIAAYHTLYAARSKVYSGSGGAGLAQMIADGFTLNSPAYKAASVICSQSPCPAQFFIGRRAMPPLQSLTLTCTDGSPGDSYNLVIVTYDGVVHTISYTIVANQGAALASSATTSVVNGSASVTFSVAQTLAIGGALQFGVGAQPGVFYFLSAAVVASTAGTLSTNYLGTTITTAPTTYTAPLAGTFHTTTGSSSVPSTASQVAAAAVGDSVMFRSQPGVYYTVTGVTALAITLATAYNGAGSATDYCVDLSPVSYAATQLETLIAAITNIGTVSVTGSVISISRTDGNLTDIQGWLVNGFANLELADVTVDPGIATDLAAIFSSNKLGWYSVSLDSNSAAEIKAAAAWVEATGQGGKVGFFNTSDWSNTNSASTTDLMSALQTSGYTKSHVVQNNQQLLSYAGCGYAAWCLVQSPGSYAIAQGANILGVPIDTDITLPESAALVVNAYTASTPTLEGKSGNFFKLTANVRASFWGVTPSGRYMDLTIFIDWLYLNMQADIFGYLASLPKVPYTQFGIASVQGVIDNRLRTASNPPYNGIDPTQPIIVNVPVLASIPTASIVARNLVGVTWSATYTGAIESVSLQGTLVL